MTNADEERLLKIIERLNRIENLPDLVADLEYENRHLQNQINNLQDDVIYLQQILSH